MGQHVPQRISITAASSDMTSANYTKLILPDGGESPTSAVWGNANIACFRITSSATGAAGTLDVLFAYPTDGTAVGTGVVARYQATVTPNSRRTKYDNSGGNYCCDTVFAETGTHFLDILGYGMAHKATVVPEVWVGMSNLGGLSTANVEVQWTRAI